MAIDNTQMITRIVAFPKPLMKAIDKYCAQCGFKDTWFIRACVVYGLKELTPQDIGALITEEYDKYHNK